MPNRITPEEIISRRFGKLTAVAFEGRNTRGQAMFRCDCDCGGVRVATYSHLNGGYIASCGCLAAEKVRARCTTHGQATRNGMTKKYRAHYLMKDRCNNPNNPQWKDWGGRGITFCPEWDAFEAFDRDVTDPPSDAHTLDRINTNGNYEPGNVKWSTRAEQNRNKRNNRMLEHNDETLCVADWALRLGIPDSRIRMRLRRGFSVAEALSTENFKSGPRS